MCTPISLMTMALNLLEVNALTGMKLLRFESGARRLLATDDERTRHIALPA